MADDLADRLRGSGYRLTPQRQLVLGAVEALGHATPDEVCDHLEGAVNTSTVYRNLEVLEELGLLRHTHLSDRAPTYHSARTAEHFHLICRSCRQVTSVTPEAADVFLAQLRRDHGFVADVGHLAVFGQCVDCDHAEPHEHDHEHPHDHPHDRTPPGLTTES